MTNAELPLLMLQLSLRESDLIYAEERVSEVESILEELNALVAKCAAEDRILIPVQDLQTILNKDRYANND